MILNRIVIFLLTVVLVSCVRSNEAIDSNFLESVLDAEECDRQIETIRENLLLLMQFADAGIRLPKGMLIGATLDLGNYHQCLGIEHYIDGMDIQGKFCSIRVPINQTLYLPGLEYTRTQYFSNFKLDDVYMNQKMIDKNEEINLRRAQILAMSGDFDALEEYYRTVPPNPLSSTVLTLGVCVPRPCTTQQAITSLLFNITAVGFDYTENYCRLRGDKPWAAVDYTTVVIFSTFGIITLISTCYDLMYRFILKRDLKKNCLIYQSFSVYTNAQRLVTFSAGPGSMQCIDGIRTIAMIWVILGHSFVTEPHIANPIDSVMWTFSAEGLWVTGATATVDTFFALGGILLIYTTAKKMTTKKFLKNLHWFYLGRIVRITPLLAMAVLFEASIMNQITDGPSWGTVVTRTERCRNYWWYTLLHIQNLLIPRNMCASHAWYVAMDMHMYVVSPLIIYWVFTGKKRNAWLALISGLVAVLTASTTFNFIKSLQAGLFVPSRGEDSVDYMPVYYYNTLTRASPFFVGLIFGYILHLYRDRKVDLPWIVAAMFWLLSIGIMSGIFYFKYAIMQFNWDNQFMDNFMNSFMRPAWASVIGWMIFACVHGYGGPINWFLSLDLWRLPARLTYGMYLFHYPLMFAINGTAITPLYFTVGLFTFKFLAHLALSVVVSYILTVVIDSPFTALFRLLTIKVQQKQAKQVENREKLSEEGKHKEDENTNVARTTLEKLDGTQDTNGATVIAK